MQELLDAYEGWIAGTPLGILARLLVALSLGAVVWVVVVVAVRASIALAQSAVQKTATKLDDDLLNRARAPLNLLGPVAGIHVAGHYHGITWVAGAAEVVEALVFAYIAVATIEILFLETWLEQRQGIKVAPLVRQILIFAVYGAVVLGFAGDAFGVDLTPLLATGSVTTVVVGLALQGPLSNLFAGIVLHIERHPAPGEWLLVDGREGEVVEIGWRTTRLRMFTDDVIVVPNATMLAATVVNYSSPTELTGRTIPVAVPLDVPPHVFDGWVRDILREIPNVTLVDTPRTKTWLVAIDDHAMRYMVRFWVVHFSKHDDAESELLKGLWYRFAREGVPFPVPHQAVKVVGETAPPAFPGIDGTRKAVFSADRPPTT